MREPHESLPWTREHGYPLGSWQRRYLDRFYDYRTGWVDGRYHFIDLVLRHVAPGTPILEIGCGPTNPVTRRLAGIGPVYGADVDPEARTNEDAVEVRLLNGPHLPFDDASLDSVVSYYVLEHVADPAGHLREVCRVLRPGGVYLARTPNRWHYVSLVSALTPHRVHVRLVRWLMRRQADAHDPYPTFYRINTERALRTLVAGVPGLEVERCELMEKDPAYGMRHPLLFLAMVGYERLVNRFSFLSRFRANLIVVLRKDGMTQ